MFVLLKRVKAVVATGDLGDFDEAVVMRMLFGRKDEGATKYEAFNVLTCVQHLDRWIADHDQEKEGGTQQHFSGMCEYAHPNWEGTLAAYHIFVDERHSELGAGRGKIPLEFGLISLRLAISMASGFCQDLAKLDGEFRSLCERDMQRRSARRAK